MLLDFQVPLRLLFLISRALVPVVVGLVTAETKKEKNKKILIDICVMFIADSLANLEPLAIVTHILTNSRTYEPIGRVTVRVTQLGGIEIEPVISCTRVCFSLLNYFVNLRQNNYTIQYPTVRAELSDRPMPSQFIFIGGGNLCPLFKNDHYCISMFYFKR